MQRNPVNAEWNKIAVMKLMYASLIRASQTWRGVTVTEFECKQLDTLRDEAERTVRTTPRNSDSTRTPLTHLQQKWDLTRISTGLAQIAPGRADHCSATLRSDQRTMNKNKLLKD